MEAPVLRAQCTSCEPGLGREQDAPKLLCAGLTLCGLRCRAAQEAEFERDYQRMMRDALDTAKRSLPKDGAKGVEIVPPVTAHKVGLSVGLSCSACVRACVRAHLHGWAAVSAWCLRGSRTFEAARTPCAHAHNGRRARERLLCCSLR